MSFSSIIKFSLGIILSLYAIRMAKQGNTLWATILVVAYIVVSYFL